MNYQYLSIMSSSLAVVGYIQELYFIIIYRKSKKSNIFIWLIWIISSGLRILYCGLNKNYLIMINFILNFFFCCVSFTLNIYFLYNNQNYVLKNIENNNDIENNKNELILDFDKNKINDNRN